MKEYLTMKIKLSKSQWESMGKQAGWMQKKSQNTREFYHGTSSGPNNEKVISFKNGINQSVAQGYGQGSGFYVWLNKNNAINHSQEFSKGGYPMIVSIQAELSPQNFDLDHEVMSSMTGQFIYDTWDNLFKRIPENYVSVERGTLNINKSRKVVESNVMVFSFGNGGTKALRPSTESDIGAGEIFGSIFNAIQKLFPQQTSDFELKAFSQVVNNTNAALKYVGSQTLIPSKIECFINNQWIDVTNQNMPQQVQSQPTQPAQSNPLAPTTPPTT